jgi:ribonuclease D
MFEGARSVAVFSHDGDLPDGLDLGPVVAVDTETLGLSLVRDPLCVVQLSAGDGDAHVVRLNRPAYDCPNLKALLANREVEKLFHFARFDVAMCKKHLGIEIGPVFCTKIASKLARTYTDRHGLKDLVKELVGVELNKQQQSSDWGADELSEAQLHYAASDVLHLHAAKARLVPMLEREGRMDLPFCPSALILIWPVGMKQTFSRTHEPNRSLHTFCRRASRRFALRPKPQPKACTPRDAGDG